MTMERIEVETIAGVIEKRLQRLILSGELRPDDALPSVYELAKETGCHPKTVASAVGRLEAKGLVRLDRGVGYIVVDLLRSADFEIFVDLLAMAKEPARKYALIAQLLGFLKPALRDMVERAALHRMTDHLTWLQAAISTLEAMGGGTVMVSAVGESEQNVLRVIAASAGNVVYTVLLNSLWSLFVPQLVLPGAATLIPVETYGELFHRLEAREARQAGDLIEAAILRREEACVAELNALGWVELPSGLVTNGGTDNH